MFHQTQLLFDQAFSYEKSGQWQSAADVLERIFEAGWKARRIAEALEALLRLGLLYNTRGERDLAAEYYELVLTISEITDDHGFSARALNGLGIIQQRGGDIARAECLYRDAQTKAVAAGDRTTIGDIDLNLGIVANIRGDLKEALRHYQGALKQYESAGSKPRLAKVLNNIGMLYTDLEQYAKASESLDRALHISRLAGEVQVEGIVLANRTELLLAIGDAEGARQACDEAFEIASRLDNGQLKAESLKYYGVIYRTSDKPHLAESHLRQAIDLAAALGYPLIEAEAYRELSLVLRGQDRNQEALIALNAAHALFTTLEAKHDQADIDKRFEQLEADFLALVAKWGESIEAKDRYTSGHCQRVAEYACQLALATGMDERELTWFRMGAFLHDVGKTVVPAEILNKPGKLTDEEREVIERHTVAGEEILSSIEFPIDIRPLVRSHHERWDGAGYPDGLSGTDIPFQARILKVVDVFDALTTTRSYRSRLSAEEALKIMLDDKGAFDPDLLALFQEMLPRLLDVLASAVDQGMVDEPVSV